MANTCETILVVALVVVLCTWHYVAVLPRKHDHRQRARPRDGGGAGRPGQSGYPMTTVDPSLHMSALSAELDNSGFEASAVSGGATVSAHEELSTFAEAPQGVTATMAGHGQGSQADEGGADGYL